MREIRGLGANALFSLLHICTSQAWADRDMARLSQGEGLGIFRETRCLRLKDKGHRFSSGGRALFPQDSHGAQSVALF